MRNRHKLAVVICVALTLILLASCASGEGSNPPSSEVYKAAAQKYIDDGDYDAAMKTLEDGLAATNDKDLSALLEEVKAAQDDSGKNQDPEPSPSANVAVMEEAMLTALEQELSRNKYCQAELIDLDGDGVNELLTRSFGNGYDNGQIYSWKNSLLQTKVMGGMVVGTTGWWLCQDIETGELGVEWESCNINDIGGTSYIYYLSHDTSITAYIPAGENSGPIVKIDEQETTWDEHDKAREQNRQVKDLFVNTDVKMAWTQLNEMLPANQQRPFPLAESEIVDEPYDSHGILYSAYDLSMFEGVYSDDSITLSLTLQPNKTGFYCELFWVHGRMLENGLVSPGIPTQLSEGTTITLDLDGMSQSLQVLLEGDDISPNPSLLYLYPNQ